MKQQLISFFLLAVLFSASPIAALAQNSAKQNFDVSSSSGFSYVSTGNGTGITNETSVSGNNSFSVINNTGNGITTGVLDFSNLSFTNFSNNRIAFRLAVLQPSGGSAGLDQSGSVVVSLSVDGGSTYATALTVTGNNNTGRLYPYAATSGTNTAVSTIFPGTPSVFQANGTLTPSFIAINLMNTVRQVKIRITLNANAKTSLLIDDVTLSSAGPLPVTLTSFAASRQSQNVFVKWNTASEINNAYFEVQRSVDSKNFTAVGKVTGNGTTATGASYSFTDHHPLAAISYYRLRQVDNDATDSYSSVVAVSGSDKIEASFYPNPTNSFVTLPAVSGLVKYRVYTATGQSIAAGEAQGGSEISLQQVPAGIYFLELITAGKHNVQRFAKQ